MTNLLLRLFIKEYPNITSASARAACGRLSGFVGIVCNVLLCAAKIAIGTLSGSVSITADGINNLSDASSSIVTLLGFRLAEKPADEGHPFGHARIEYLSGLAVAGMILVIGVQLAIKSVEKILHPSQIVFSGALVVVLVLSMAVKLWMALFNWSLGKKIQSATLTATAADSRNDVLSTGAVLLSCLVGHFFHLAIDGYAGLLVALFIVWSGAGIAKDTISPLLGENADPELIRQIAGTLRGGEKVLGFHDLMVHDYGPGRKFASVHVEMDAAEDPLVCHNIIDDLERAIKDVCGVSMTIHYDPVVTNDQALSEIRALVQEILGTIDGRLTMHDFRVVPGPMHTNLVFDLVVPDDLAKQRSAIQEKINAGLRGQPMQYYTVITFDALAFNQP